MWQSCKWHRDRTAGGASFPSPGPPGFAENFSAQRTRPVICITTKSVRMEPMVTARPVKPLKKKA
ncbi:MAG TPA: hypothetical protein VN282_27290 [Pyrinomonadaceae bacterium]|nr:hypothetical protein [Pyrinomonadaceae bacterium]